MTVPAHPDKALVGVSRCLLGDRVRYDGGHKYDQWVNQVLAEHFEYHPVCPEMAIGLGVPRKPIHLVITDAQTRVCGVEEPDLDVTDALASEAERTLNAAPKLSGFIFMQNSPSCGVHGVKRYIHQGTLLDTNGQGAFAARLIKSNPLLPVEEAKQLAEPAVRNNFITRIQAYHDWQYSLEKNPSPAALKAFYSRYKSKILARHPTSWSLIEHLLANKRGRDCQRINQELAVVFMQALRQE